MADLNQFMEENMQDLIASLLKVFGAGTGSAGSSKDDVITIPRGEVPTSLS